MSGRARRATAVVTGLMVAALGGVHLAAPAEAAAGVVGGTDSYIDYYYDSSVPSEYTYYRITAHGWAYNAHTKPSQGVRLYFYDDGGKLIHVTSTLPANQTDAADAKAHHTSTKKIGWSFDTGKHETTSGHTWQNEMTTMCAYAHDYGGSDAFRKIGSCHHFTFRRITSN